MTPACKRTRAHLVFLASILVAGSALAEPSPAEREAAHTLFEDGRAAMKNGDWRTACPKLEQSQHLHPGIGTLFNLASCYEGQGRLASAWTTFREVAEAALRADQTERAEAAKDSAAALEPRLGHLRVTLDGPERRALTLDGAPFAEGLVDTSFPIDAGGHDVGADAPGKKHWAIHIEARDGTTAVVPVPPLEDVAVTAIPLIETPLAITPVDNLTPPQLPPVSAPTSAPSWHTTGAIVAEALGLVGFGVSTALAVGASRDWSTAQSEGCVGSYCPVGAASSSWSAAHSAAIGSTASFVVGSALVATGAVIWFTKPMASARVGLGPDGGVVVSGRFP